ncbi:methylated-DNA--[protein]-cysteine S-methyltransferase [Neolewinella lacunae]|uniref:methylated-DNA--[protein]-cysteine S-methyltransferase n=1 Tax=Neolewinella lacunae TaxID=1517758 RepID=A0A923PHF8_9BACT|nr:methylated-DNA--[protein]-cysteine S-methyltransferase [Neolewinella lacunae]MBC6994193.1 methylated-DNA--[protein]-cysteine S-methyltransferase [Neolewinella lacunae]MDN3634648.1 methylated-DNA--[protein]-cysteine S-methyltransferase [Neolewinella lacunae]
MATTWLHSDFGTFQMSASALGLTELRLMDIKVPQGMASENPHLRAASEQLLAYFAGELTEFDVALDWSGATEFHRAAWTELCAIGYGRTVSYQYIADRLGDPKASQAVGQANRRNPIAIIVPCHRVIAKTGDLQGYFYGLDFKRRLLALENPRSFAEQGSLF